MRQETEKAPTSAGWHHILWFWACFSTNRMYWITSVKTWPSSGEACTSSQFGKFISLSEDISHFNRELEHLFLERRTSDESLQYLDSNVNKLQEALDQIKEESPLTIEKL